MTRSHAQLRFILASGSPRRAELLAEHGYSVSIIPPPVDEPADLNPSLLPAQLAHALSYFKARSVRELVGDGLILAGDTIASFRGRIFGKPRDRDDARAILGSLSGTTHEVITAITLLDAADGRRLIQHDTTEVVMRRLSPDEIEAYLDTGEWQGKAGAYGIQDYGDAFVERIEGSFTNVVGLPVELVERMLKQWNCRE